MTWGSILSESWRNTLSGATHALVWGIVTFVLVVAASCAEILQSHAVTLQAQEYTDKGASIITLQAPGHIDPDACEALNTVEGVRAAGALALEDERLRLSVLPSAPVPIATVTPTFPEVLHADAHGRAGAIISDQVADKTGASPGDTISSDQGELNVAGSYAYPEDGRASGYGYMILVPSSTKSAYDECWVDAWPQSDLVTGLVYSALIPSKDAEATSPKLGQLNSTLGAHFTGAPQFDTRITRFAPLAVALACFVLGFVSIRLRRLQLASDLHAGASRHDLGMIVLLDTTWWLTPALLLAESATVIFTAALGALDDAAPLVLANRIIWAAAVATLAGVALGWTLTREQHLFNYFKTR